MKKTEKFFILGLLVFALLLWVAMNVFRPDSYGSIRITVNGTVYGIYPLSEDQTISIEDTNICEIKDHKVSMTYADCPDQFCVRQGAIDSGGGMIVCLPNKITIEGIKTSAADGVDSIS